MTQAVYSIEEIKKKLEPIFMAAPIKKAILFGSYAKGQQHANSDVDILIDSEGEIRGLDFFGVLEDVTVCLNKRVDLIEKYQIHENSAIYHVIEKEGVVLYEG